MKAKTALVVTLVRLSTKIYSGFKTRLTAYLPCEVIINRNWYLERSSADMGPGGVKAIDEGNENDYYCQHIKKPEILGKSNSRVKMSKPLYC